MASARRVGDLDQPVQSRWLKIARRLVISFHFQWTLTYPWSMKMHEINFLIFSHLDRIIFIVNDTWITFAGCKTN